MFALSGNEGPEGPAGPAGPQGEQGAIGKQGATGPAGPAGSQGPIGPQGPEGPGGATGAAGATGPQGPQEPTGPQGQAGDSHWSIIGGDTYYTNGMVGIGTASPTSRLHVEDNASDSHAVMQVVTADTGDSQFVWGIRADTFNAYNAASSGAAIYGAGSNVGVRGDSSSTNGIDVVGASWTPNGPATGVFGHVGSPEGVMPMTSSRIGLHCLASRSACLLRKSLKSSPAGWMRMMKAISMSLNAA